MNYFISDFKKIIHNKLILGIFAFMLIACIGNPFVNYFTTDFALFGDYPYPYWFLMNFHGVGPTIYETMIFVFPVIVTGLIFYHEKQSSIYNFLISRNSRIKYLLSKVFTAFVSTFLIFFIPLAINILITETIFPGSGPLTEQYLMRIPNAGSFAEYFYNISPFAMGMFYALLNAFVIAMLTVLTVGVHMIFRFKNMYLALMAPTIGIYLLSYVSLMIHVVRGTEQSSLGVVINPVAASAYTQPPTFPDLYTAISSLIILSLTVVIIGFIRNRESV